MARNEFGVESSDSGGFGAGVGSDFDDMFEQANSLSVVDDEVAAPETRRRRSNRQAEQTPVYSDAPLEEQSFEPIAKPEPEFSFADEPEREQNSEVLTGFDAPSFGQTEDVDFMFEEAEGRALVDDEPSIADTDIPEFLSNLTGESSTPQEEPFEDFGASSADGSDLLGFEGSSADEHDLLGFEDSAIDEQDEFTDWVDPAIAADFEDEQPQLSFGNSDPANDPQPSFAPETVQQPSFEQPQEPVSYREPVAEQKPVAEPVATPEPVVTPVEPTISEPRPSYEPATQETVPTVPVAVQQPVVAPDEGSVDYIERVILTSDAIRDLPEDDAKAVNLFITAGQPVATHQELVLAALFADRQILKTADAILEAKSKSSLDQAFFILALDDETFVDFGKILSHDLAATETVRFEGDRLQYARKLVDVVDSLPAESIARFEAVRSVLGAGELNS